MSVYTKLLAIQALLKAPKNQRNTFGKYNYRSCEDILEAVKPILSDQKCVLVLSDMPEISGEWHYIRATARLVDAETGESVENTAFARESAVKKGMDDSQITGTASSYARKYALNGLFCIDDTKDADTDEYKRGQNQQNSAPTEGEQPVCRQCGGVVNSIKQNGTVISAKDFYAKSGGLCGTCYRKNRNGG